MKRKLVIFHLLNNYTGSPRVLRTVIEGLDRDKYDISLYTSKSQGFLSNIEGITYYSNFYFRSRYRFITLFSFFFSQIILSIRLLFSGERSSKTIYYVNTILPFSALVIARLKGIRSLCHVHEFRISPSPLSAFLFKITNTFSNSIILVSEFLRVNHKHTNANVHVVYNAVSKDFLCEDRIPNTRGTSFSVLMIASLRPYKGIYEFIGLAARLKDIRFVLVVSDGKPATEMFFRNQSLGENVEIHSNPEDVKLFYKNADLVVNLSDKRTTIETFGLTVIEAMTFGIPSIVPVVGGIAELVDDGVNGFKIDSKDDRKLIETICMLRDDVSLWNQLSQASFRRSRGFFPKGFQEQINRVLDNCFVP
nr:glycosyltransferase [Cytophagales bacterium]